MTYQAQRRFVGSVAILFLVITGSCRTTDIGIGMMSVFNDFIFVGQGPIRLTKEGDVDTSYVPEHGDLEQTRPQKLVIGTTYIFHYADGLFDDEEFAVRILRERLKEIDIIVPKPLSETDLIYSYVGGPFFKMHFQDGMHEGFIFNQLDGLHPLDAGPLNGETYSFTYIK